MIIKDWQFESLIELLEEFVEAKITATTNDSTEDAMALIKSRDILKINLAELIGVQYDD